MDKKICLSIILFFSLSILAGSGAAFAASDNSYTIPLINQDIYLQNDGSIHVVEKIHYTFDGTFHGINRYIPLNGSQQLTNVNVTTDGAYNSFQILDVNSTKDIKVYLYSDAAKTQPINGGNVTVTISYDLFNVMKFYNDIAELHYMLVPNKWQVDIGQVVANIHTSSSQGIQYWLNPPYYNKSAAWQGNTLTVTSDTIPAGQYYEIRMAIPRDQFAATPSHGLIINQNGLAQIQQLQNDYQNSLNFRTNLYYFLSVLMFLALFVPLLIYFRYGREPKIDYQAEYERDIPTDDPPAMVNAICGPGFSKKIGEPDMDGFKATIMDLINRKYLIMENEPLEEKSLDKEGYGLVGSMYLRYNVQKDSSELKSFEKNVINFLTEYEDDDGLISLDAISDNLSVRESARSFRNTYLDWKDNLRNTLLNNNELDKFFNKKGDSYLKIFGVLALIVAVIVFFFSIMDDIPAANLSLLLSIVLGVVAIISLLLPQKVGGQWTTYGEEYDAKWHNFKKYIQDFSLMKEYPPESIVIWNKYLVYATALGAADAVRKAMELNVPKDDLNGSDLYMFHYYGGYLLLDSAFDTGMTTATASSSNGGDFGGVGDIGGGFGGGGGGDAF
ncbi:Protein of unknown function DUF2207, membrane [Methanobacterium lacus]|uniref:DUF2207 domain-containing protein n=1 Tax=Methanobacterium lacus (strain AL-21) TaxID=877455 RepID=F0TA83_METLA|nr:DUF2207 domain-containing protein [Methanobacterium lacus]ADZ10033.1 Protein of unknown function DUF2207, membrane [Methanobacterium lacus]